MSDAQITFSSFSMSLCVSFFPPPAIVFFFFFPFYFQTECVNSLDFLSGSPSKTQPLLSPTSIKVKITLLYCQGGRGGREEGQATFGLTADVLNVFSALKFSFC